MKESKREEIRGQLHLLNPRTANDIADDYSNLDDIMQDYDKLYKIGRELIVIENRTLAEGLSAQGAERQFFGYCASLLRSIVRGIELELSAARGKLYREIAEKHSRDYNDRAINQLIDGNDTVFEINMRLIQVREYYEKFSDMVESYNQRGFALNNLTRAMGDAFDNAIINE